MLDHEADIAKRQGRLGHVNVASTKFYDQGLDVSRRRSNFPNCLRTPEIQSDESAMLTVLQLSAGDVWNLRARTQARREQAARVREQQRQAEAECGEAEAANEPANADADPSVDAQQGPPAKNLVNGIFVWSHELVSVAKFETMINETSF